MDLFKSDFDEVEKEVVRQRENDKKRSREITTTKHYKRYGTKKPEKRMKMNEILDSWRDDI
jgi:hypothetical protein